MHTRFRQHYVSSIRTNPLPRPLHRALFPVIRYDLPAIELSKPAGSWGLEPEEAPFAPLRLEMTLMTLAEAPQLALSLDTLVVRLEGIYS